MNVRIKPYLEMWGNERDWDRVEIVTLAHTQPHHTSPFAKEKFLFLSNKNLRKNLHLLGKLNLTLRRPNFIGAHVPVAPDLAKTVKVGSDDSKNLTSVFNGAKNEKFSFRTIYIY